MDADCVMIYTCVFSAGHKRRVKRAKPEIANMQRSFAARATIHKRRPSEKTTKRWCFQKGQFYWAERSDVVVWHAFARQKASGFRPTMSPHSRRDHTSALFSAPSTSLSPSIQICSIWRPTCRQLDGGEGLGQVWQRSSSAQGSRLRLFGHPRR